MTDEELIEQLRSEPTWGGLVALTKKAADRIEALTAKLAKAEAGLFAIAKRVELYRRENVKEESHE